jgi:hypothetical protein
MNSFQQIITWDSPKLVEIEIKAMNKNRKKEQKSQL